MIRYCKAVKEYTQCLHYALCTSVFLMLPAHIKRFNKHVSKSNIFYLFIYFLLGRSVKFVHMTLKIFIVIKFIIVDLETILIIQFIGLCMI
jgi:hypothetical protein